MKTLSLKTNRKISYVVLPLMTTLLSSCTSGGRISIEPPVQKVESPQKAEPNGPKREGTSTAGGGDTQNPTSKKPEESTPPVSKKLQLNISAGLNFTCASANGSAYCWGNNEHGQLGTGKWMQRNTPTPVFGLQNSVKEVFAGGTHACAVLVNGDVYCWGNDNYGQLGDGRISPDPLTLKLYAQSPVFAAVLPKKMESISVGLDSNCGISNQNAICWGRNRVGQLGDGTLIDRNQPVQVVGMEGGVTSISTSDHHACAVQNGKVFCWGNNASGQLGNNSVVDSLVPVEVKGLKSKAVAVHVGITHSCVLTENHSVYCWGKNDKGQVGDGTGDDQWVPILVDGLDQNVAALAVGGQHSCATTLEGELRCWGYNALGQLGNNSTVSAKNPVTVTGITGKIESFGLGGNHSCVTTSDEKMYCWGKNLNGQLGDSNSFKDSWVPKLISSFWN